MTWKPRLRTIVASLGAVVALGVAQAGLDDVAAARVQGAAQAPRYEVDPFWPKPLPNHWVLGNAIGVWVDARDNVWIVHRGSDTLAANEKALELKAGDCCAGAPGVLAFDKARQPGPALGRSRAGLRLARLEPRHLRRPHRHGVDWRQRPGRLAHHEVHPGRQVRGAVRQAQRAGDRQEREGAANLHARQQRSRRTSAGSPRSSSSRRPTRPTSPTATSTGASPCSMPRPAR